MSAVVCFVETDGGVVTDASLRAITLSRSLAGPGGVEALLVSEPAPAVAAQLRSFGVAAARHLEVPGVSGHAPLVIAAALAEMVAEGTCAVVAAATDHGNEVLAHLGARRDLEFAANCTEAHRREEGGFSLVRQRWGGSLVEDATLDAPLALFSVAADGVAAVPAPATEAPVVTAITPVLDEGDIALQAVESTQDTGGVSLASAKVVVSGGRGVGNAEGFGVVEELASLLGGAVGVSRAVTSAGWRPHREQVGQTGTKVAPDLYLACGISGAIQHLAGCQGAKQMIAINTDADAPIMSRADYAVIGDVSVVLPALVDAVKKRRAGS